MQLPPQQLKQLLMHSDGPVQVLPMQYPVQGMIVPSCIWMFPPGPAALHMAAQVGQAFRGAAITVAVRAAEARKARTNFDEDRTIAESLEVFKEFIRSHYNIVLSYTQEDS